MKKLGIIVSCLLLCNFIRAQEGLPPFTSEKLHNSEILARYNNCRARQGLVKKINRHCNKLLKKIFTKSVCKENNLCFSIISRFDEMHKENMKNFNFNKDTILKNAVEALKIIENAKNNIKKQWEAEALKGKKKHKKINLIMQMIASIKFFVCQESFEFRSDLLCPRIARYMLDRYNDYFSYKGVHEAREFVKSLKTKELEKNSI